MINFYKDSKFTHMINQEQLSQPWDTLVVHTTHGKQPLSLNKEEGTASIEGENLVITLENVSANGPDGTSVGTVSVKDHIALSTIVQFTLIKRTLIQPVPQLVGIKGN